MEAPVKHTYFHVVDRIAGQYACCHCLFKTFLNGRNELTGNRSSEKIVYKLVMFVRILCSPFCIYRTKFKNDIGKFTASPRLFFQRLAMFNSALESFLISYLRRSLVHFHFKFSLHTIDDDLKM